MIYSPTTQTAMPKMRLHNTGSPSIKSRTIVGVISQPPHKITNHQTAHKHSNGAGVNGDKVNGGVVHTNPAPDKLNARCMNVGGRGLQVGFL